MCMTVCIRMFVLGGLAQKMEAERKFALVIKMLKPWDIKAFAREHDGLMVHVFCVFVEKRYVAHFVQFCNCIEA